MLGAARHGPWWLKGIGWWRGIQGDASALGKLLLSSSVQAGEEGNFRDQLYRGNNSWAFLIWKVLHLNLVENWDRGPALLPVLDADRGGAAVQQAGLPARGEALLSLV